MYRLLVTGDLMVGEKTERERNRVKEPVKKLIASLHVDAVLGNLEVPLTDRGFPADKMIFWRSPPSTAMDLKEMGFSMLSLATNHTLDYGVEGLFDTIAILDREKIKRAGAGKNLTEAFKPIKINKNGQKLAIFSVTSSLPGYSAAGQDRPGAAPIRIRTMYEFDTKRLQERPGFPPYIHTEAMAEDVQRVSREIKEIKKKGYNVLVAIHWGDPYQKMLAGYQRPLAELLIKSGCDFILGHHPHTFHAIELLNKVPVLYSVGNFIRTRRLDKISKKLFPGRDKETWQMTFQALVAVAVFQKNKISEIEIYPILIQDGIPALATCDAAERILNEVESLSGQNLSWRIRDGVGFIKLN